MADEIKILQLGSTIRSVIQALIHEVHLCNVYCSKLRVVLISRER